MVTNNQGYSPNPTKTQKDAYQWGSLIYTAKSVCRQPIHAWCMCHIIKIKLQTITMFTPWLTPWASTNTKMSCLNKDVLVLHRNSKNSTWKKSLIGRLMVKKACNWLIVSQTNHFVSTGICDCYCRGSIAGPAGPALAGLLFSGAFSDCRDSVRTRWFGQVSHANSPLPCVYAFLVIVPTLLPADQEPGVARADCIGTHTFCFHKWFLLPGHIACCGPDCISTHPFWFHQ